MSHFIIESRIASVSFVFSSNIRLPKIETRKIILKICRAEDLPEMTNSPLAKGAYVEVAFSGKLLMLSITCVLDKNYLVTNGREIDILIND